MNAMVSINPKRLIVVSLSKGNELMSFLKKKKKTLNMVSTNT